MDNELSALFGFLERYGSEVSGREIAPPDSGIAETLIRFARGECTPEERIAACEALRERPAWLRWLADQVKLKRMQELKEVPLVSGVTH